MEQRGGHRSNLSPCLDQPLKYLELGYKRSMPWPSSLQHGTVNHRRIHGFILSSRTTWKFQPVQTHRYLTDFCLSFFLKYLQFQRNMLSNSRMSRARNIMYFSPAESIASCGEAAFRLTGARVVLLLSCRHDPSSALALKALIAPCSTVLGFFLCGPQWLSWESTHNSRMAPD